MQMSNGVAENWSPLIPKPIKTGDLVAVVAPAGPPNERLLNSGLEFWEHKGFKVLTGRHLRKSIGYLAGSDSDRVEDLNDAFKNPEVKAVIFARGGYGSMRILNGIDCNPLTKNPKMLLGMSDVTALQMSLLTRCGLVSLAGPLLAGQVGEGLDPLSEGSLMRALTEPLEGQDLFHVVMKDVRILRPGKDSGRLLGGCLSMIVALLGTPHLPNFSGAILFLEDVQEPPYRLDRMFTQLHLSGVLDVVNGVILGHFVGPDDSDIQCDAERILLELTRDRVFPIVSGFPHGHKLPNITVPSGFPAVLDTSVPSLTLDAGLSHSSTKRSKNDSYSFQRKRS